MVLIVACAPLVGCAPSGEDPLSQLSVFAPPSGEYRLRYLAPPWQLVQAEGTTAILEIARYGGLDGGPGAYELIVTVEPGDVDARMVAEERAAASRGETTLAGPRSVRAHGEGVEGRELLTSGEAVYGVRHHRYVYFPLPAARVVRLAFEATPDLDTAEVDAMIAATGVGPEDP